MKVNIKLENCFGIGKFEEEFDFTESKKTYLIYAPNGTMKTSFAKTFECVAKNTKTEKLDRVYTDRVTKCEILADDNKIEPTSIFVVHTEENGFDASNKISSFLASKELKNEYDLIYTELNKAKVEFVKKLKNVSSSSDCETEFTSTFGVDGKDNFFSNLLAINEQITEKHIKYSFKYNDIFDKKGNVKKFIEANKVLIQQYFEHYSSLLEKSKFFRKTIGGTFGTVQANDLLSSIEDGTFFQAEHKLVLQDNQEITTFDMLKDIVDNEISSIVNDKGLKKTFDDIDKKVRANTELKQFKVAIEKDNSLLAKLQNFEDFKKEVWLGYFYELKNDVQDLTNLYTGNRKRLEVLLTKAKQETETWKNIIKLFNDRFYVPFTVKIINHEDIILKQDSANLEFDYKDSDDPAKNQNKDELLKILSRGEQRAYYILHIMFEIEARKKNGSSSLIIFDDIADSFDYKNKYAIIEYIQDIHSRENFNSIILTHNFDFYRTLASRLYLNDDSVYMAIKKKDRSIKLKKGQYRNDVFTYFSKNTDKPKMFISMVPFVRNIVEYIEQKNSTDYVTLTCCLHKKNSSKNVFAKDILSIYKTKIEKCENKDITFGDKNIHDLVHETANSIINEINIDEVLLENKIVLSISIRLLAETYMINALAGSFDELLVKSNQTRELFNLYKQLPNIEIDKLQKLDKVNLMTPENIHVNAFMYEPLIDMSVNHLIDLHKQIAEL